VAAHTVAYCNCHLSLGNTLCRWPWYCSTVISQCYGYMDWGQHSWYISICNM